MNNSILYINSFVRDLAYSEYASRGCERSKLDFRHVNNPYIAKKVTSFLRDIDAARILEYHYAQNVDLIKKISKKEGVSPDNIIITEGADGALHHVAETFLSFGKQALIPVPSFPRCEFHTKVVGVKPTFVNVYGLKESKKLDLICERARKGKYDLIFLETPNNPTGETFTRSALLGFLDETREGIVVVDQALGGYFDDSIPDLVCKRRNLIIAKSFSKLFGLPGLRIGYVIAPKNLVAYIRKTVSPFGISTMSIFVANYILESDSCVIRSKDEVVRSLDYIKRHLQIGFSESKGPFILLNGGRQFPHLYETLLGQGILTVDGKNFRGLEKTNSVRVSLADHGAIVKLVNAIDNLQSLKYS